MPHILILIHVFICIFLILLVLVQRSKGDMSAFGGGVQSVFGGQGPTTFLARLTAIFAALFFISTLVLAFAIKHESAQDNAPIVTDVATAPKSTPATESHTTKSDVNKKISDTT